MRAMGGYVFTLLGTIGPQNATQLTRRVPLHVHAQHHTPRRELGLEGSGRQRFVSFDHRLEHGHDVGVGGEDSMIEALDSNRSLPVGRMDRGPSVPDPRAMLPVCRRLRDHDLVERDGDRKRARWRLSWLGMQIYVIHTI